jgi:hypothetical protein
MGEEPHSLPPPLSPEGRGVPATERVVLSVWITLLIVGVTLMVILWAGTAFLQGYFYTEVSSSIFWQAPAAAAALTLFYALWCLLNYNAAESRPGFLPYDTIFRFSQVEYKAKEPPLKIWVLTKGKTEKVLFELIKRADPVIGTTYEYQHKRVGGNLRWPRDVVALIVPEDGQDVRYDPEPAGEGANRRFVSPDGWAIVEYETGPAHPPEKARFGLWLVNVFLNLFHFGLWFVCLWLLLRFQWGHAFGLAIVMWLVMTVFAVPMMLVQTGDAAQEARRRQRTAAQLAPLRPVPPPADAHGPGAARVVGGWVS